MKNVLFAVLFLCCAFVAQPGLAHGYSVSPQRHDGLIEGEFCSVFPLQISIWPGADWKGQLCAGDVEIWGASLGLIGFEQKSSIVSVAPIANGLTGNLFLQCSPWVNLANRNYGVQVGFLSFAPNEDDVAWNGFQVGFCNVCGTVQTGCINAAVEERFSLQAGFFNAAEFGFQFGVCNVGGDGTSQIGLFNIGLEGDVFQFGLLNYNKDGILPWIPLFNFSLE